MNVACKVKLKLERSYNSSGYRYFMNSYIKYKINKEWFSSKLDIVLIEQYINIIDDSIFDIKNNEQELINQFIQKCEDLINNMDELKKIIKDEVIKDIDKNNKRQLKEDAIFKLEEKINSIKISIDFKI